MTAPPPTTARSGGTARRGGFTLLELLIAISVIALLLALLVPAIRQVMGTANDTAVSSEIKGIEGGLSQFHQMYNTMPPSFLDLRRNAGGFVNPATMPALRQVFGTSIDQGAMVTSLNNMDFPNGTAANSTDFSTRGVLRGAECLVFFLGGVPADGKVVGGEMVPGKELAGFSKNPRDPFNVTRQPATGAQTGFVLLDKGRRAGPFYGFMPDRLRYVNEVEGGSAGDTQLSYFTYVDGMTAQKAPVMYASSDGGRAYEPLHIAYVGGVFDNSDGESTAFDPQGAGCWKAAADLRLAVRHADQPQRLPDHLPRSRRGVRDGRDVQLRRRFRLRRVPQRRRRGQRDELLRRLPGRLTRSPVPPTAGPPRTTHDAPPRPPADDRDAVPPVRARRGRGGRSR